MKLESIELKGFQRHHHLKVEFSPGVTTIIGPSDCGKSAILRALRWTCLNDFAGDDFVRKGEKRAEVVLKIRDGKEVHTIRRAKGSSLNVYELDGREFVSFGTKVPDEIASVLRLSEINFQDQHDPPFWFYDTAGEVSRKLNEIVNLELIDRSLAFVAKEVREAQSRCSVFSEVLAKTELELKQVEPLRQRIQDFEKLKKLEEELESLRSKFGTLQQLVLSHQQWKKEAKENTARLQVLEELLEVGEQWRELTSKQSRIQSLIHEYQQWKSQYHPVPDFAPLEACYQELKSLEQKVERLEVLVSSFRQQKKLYLQLKQEAEEAEARFHESTKGQACPFCGQIIQ
jgi:exonuclease SbcC